MHLIRDQRDDLESRLAASNEVRFSRLSGECSIELSLIFFSSRIDNNANDRLRTEENLKLRENILHSYRKQLEVRRALLELDTGLMDVNHECTRNESVVEQ